MKVSTSITSSLIAIIATLSSHSVHVNGELRFLKPDNKECTTPCDCFVEVGVRGETKQQIATCKIFVGEGAGVNECRNQCVGPVEAAKLITNKGATCGCCPEPYLNKKLGIVTNCPRELLSN